MYLKLHLINQDETWIKVPHIQNIVRREGYTQLTIGSKRLQSRQAAPLKKIVEVIETPLEIMESIEALKTV